MIAQDSEEASSKSNDEIQNPKVLFDTTLGTFMVELYPDKAPLTVAHFLKQIENDYYDGLVFHRVRQGFVIQAGSFNQEYEHQKVEDTVINEASNGLSNDKGTLAMARGDHPDSASSDFYINLSDNKFLNPRGSPRNPDGYTVFGKVIRGMDIVEKIAEVEVATRETEAFPNPLENVPVENVVIKQASTYE